MVVVWTLALSVAVVFCLYTHIFATSFGNEATRVFLLTYCLGLGFTYGIVEPFQVALLVLVPVLMTNAVAVEIRARYNDVFG